MNEKPPEKTGLGLKNSPSWYPDNVHWFEQLLHPDSLREIKGMCEKCRIDEAVTSSLVSVEWNAFWKYSLSLNQLLNKQQKYTWWIFTLSNCLSLVGKGIWFIKAWALLSLSISIDSQGTHRSTEERITPAKKAHFRKRIVCWNDRKYIRWKLVITAEGEREQAVEREGREQDAVRCCGRLVWNSGDGTRGVWIFFGHSFTKWIFNRSYPVGTQR